MKKSGFSKLASALLVCGVALMAPAMAAQQGDFVRPAAHVPVSPAQAAAVQALQTLALRVQADAGSLPKGFPFDVQDVSDLAQAHIAYGFQVYDADPASLMAGESLEKSARATGIWRFAVMIGDKPIGLMTMAQAGSGWNAVSMGGAGLVKEVDAVVYAHGGAAQLHYVRVPQATADFIEVKSGSADARFVPLLAARESLRLAAGAGGDGLVADRVLQPALREAVSRNSAN